MDDATQTVDFPGETRNDFAPPAISVKDRETVGAGEYGDRRAASWGERLPLPRLQRRKRASAKPLPPKVRRRRRLVRLGVVLALIAVLLTQANGPLGAYGADLMRAALGPQLTAQIESWYLGVQDAAHRAQYQFSGQHTSAPWQSGGTPTPSPSPAPSPSSARSPSAARPVDPGMPLPSITPLFSPALPGEGVWTTDGLPSAGPGRPPLVAKTFLRPDPERPFAVVTVLQFDLRYVRLHLVAGTSQPGGPLHMGGPGAIPAADQQGQALLAAFNGGFKYADGHYGMMVDGKVYVPAQPGAATIAVTSNGTVLLGAWGRDPGLTPDNSRLVAWRQNGALLVDGGQINPLTHDGAAWGGTVLNSTFTWRSAVGITDHGTLLYAAGNSLSAETLGRALQAAGATMAMQTDINPFWVRAFTYQRDPGGAWHISALHPGMQGSGDEYLRGSERDFFYVTRGPAVPARGCDRGATPGTSSCPAA